MVECSTTLEYDIEEEMMKRLTNEAVRVDESVSRYLGPLADIKGMKPKLLDLILNGPTLNGVSKDVLRQIIRQLYSELAAYEDTGLTPESVEALKLSVMGKAIAEIKEFNGLPVNRLRELAEADKDGRLVVLPCKMGDKLYRVFAGEIFEHRVGSMKYFAIQGHWDIETYPFCPCVESSIGKTIFLTREEAEKALEATEK